MDETFRSARSLQLSTLDNAIHWYRAILSKSRCVREWYSRYPLEMVLARALV